MTTFSDKQQERYIKLYDFIFNHEDFYEIRLTSKYLFCVMMDYMELENDSEESITIPHETLANDLQLTGRSITTLKNELKKCGLINETFMGIGKVTKISFNQDKINQYKDKSGVLTYITLPRNVYEERNLSISSKVLYAFLLHQMKDSESEGVSLSNESIGKILNVSLSKARKTKKELVEQGKITEQRRGYAQANTIYIAK